MKIVVKLLRCRSGVFRKYIVICGIAVAATGGAGRCMNSVAEAIETLLDEHTDRLLKWNMGNGLVRLYFPKAIDFGGILNEDARKVVVLLNTRPRAALGYASTIFPRRPSRSEPIASAPLISPDPQV